MMWRRRTHQADRVSRSVSFDWIDSCLPWDCFRTLRRTAWLCPRERRDSIERYFNRCCGRAPNSQQDETETSSTREKTALGCYLSIIFCCGRDHDIDSSRETTQPSCICPRPGFTCGRVGGSPRDRNERPTGGDSGNGFICSPSSQTDSDAFPHGRFCFGRWNRNYNINAKRSKSFNGNYSKMIPSKFADSLMSSDDSSQRCLNPIALPLSIRDSGCERIRYLPLHSKKFVVESSNSEDSDSIVFFQGCCGYATFNQNCCTGHPYLSRCQSVSDSLLSAKRDYEIVFFRGKCGYASFDSDCCRLLQTMHNSISPSSSESDKQRTYLDLFPEQENQVNLEAENTNDTDACRSWVTSPTWSLKICPSELNMSSPSEDSEENTTVPVFKSKISSQSLPTILIMSCDGDSIEAGEGNDSRRTSTRRPKTECSDQKSKQHKQHLSSSSALFLNKIRRGKSEQSFMKKSRKPKKATDIHVAVTDAPHTNDDHMGGKKDETSLPTVNAGQSVSDNAVRSMAAEISYKAINAAIVECENSENAETNNVPMLNSAELNELVFVQLTVSPTIEYDSSNFKHSGTDESFKENDSKQTKKKKRKSKRKKAVKTKCCERERHGEETPNADSNVMEISSQDSFRPKPKTYHTQGKEKYQVEVLKLDQASDDDEVFLAEEEYNNMKKTEMKQGNDEIEIVKNYSSPTHSNISESSCFISKESSISIEGFFRSRSFASETSFERRASEEHMGSQTEVNKHVSEVGDQELQNCPSNSEDSAGPGSSPAVRFPNVHELMSQETESFEMLSDPNYFFKLDNDVGSKFNFEIHHAKASVSEMTSELKPIIAKSSDAYEENVADEHGDRRVRPLDVHVNTDPVSSHARVDSAKELSNGSRNNDATLDTFVNTEEVESGRSNTCKLSTGSEHAEEKTLNDEREKSKKLSQDAREDATTEETPQAERVNIKELSRDAREGATIEETSPAERANTKELSQVAREDAAIEKTSPDERANTITKELSQDVHEDAIIEETSPDERANTKELSLDAHANHREKISEENVNTKELSPDIDKDQHIEDTASDESVNTYCLHVKAQERLKNTEVITTSTETSTLTTWSAQPSNKKRSLFVSNLNNIEFLSIDSSTPRLPIPILQGDPSEQEENTFANSKDYTLSAIEKLKCPDQETLPTSTRAKGSREGSHPSPQCPLDSFRYNGAPPVHEYELPKPREASVYDPRVDIFVAESIVRAVNFIACHPFSDPEDDMTDSTNTSKESKYSDTENSYSRNGHLEPDSNEIKETNKESSNKENTELLIRGDRFMNQDCMSIDSLDLIVPLKTEETENSLLNRIDLQPFNSNSVKSSKTGVSKHKDSIDIQMKFESGTQDKTEKSFNSIDPEAPIANSMKSSKTGFMKHNDSLEIVRDMKHDPVTIQGNRSTNTIDSQLSIQNSMLASGPGYETASTVPQPDSYPVSCRKINIASQSRNSILWQDEENSTSEEEVSPRVSSPTRAILATDDRVGRNVSINTSHEKTRESGSRRQAGENVNRHDSTNEALFSNGKCLGAGITSFKEDVSAREYTTVVSNCLFSEANNFSPPILHQPLEIVFGGCEKVGLSKDRNVRCTVSGEFKVEQTSDTTFREELLENDKSRPVFSVNHEHSGTNGNSERPLELSKEDKGAFTCDTGHVDPSVNSGESLPPKQGYFTQYLYKHEPDVLKREDTSDIIAQIVDLVTSTEHEAVDESTTEAAPNPGGRAQTDTNSEDRPLNCGHSITEGHQCLETIPRDNLSIITDGPCTQSYECTGLLNQVQFDNLLPKAFVTIAVESQISDTRDTEKVRLKDTGTTHISTETNNENFFLQNSEAERVQEGISKVENFAKEENNCSRSNTAKESTIKDEIVDKRSSCEKGINSSSETYDKGGDSDSCVKDYVKDYVKEYSDLCKSSVENERRILKSVLESVRGCYSPDSSKDSSPRDPHTPQEYFHKELSGGHEESLEDYLIAQYLNDSRASLQGGKVNKESKTPLVIGARYPLFRAITEETEEQLEAEVSEKSRVDVNAQQSVRRKGFQRQSKVDHTHCGDLKKVKPNPYKRAENASPSQIRTSLKPESALEQSRTKRGQSNIPVRKRHENTKGQQKPIKLKRQDSKYVGLTSLKQSVPPEVPAKQTESLDSGAIVIIQKSRDKQGDIVKYEKHLHTKRTVNQQGNRKRFRTSVFSGTFDEGDNTEGSKPESPKKVRGLQRQHKLEAIGEDSTLSDFVANSKSVSSTESIHDAENGIKPADSGFGSSKTATGHSPTFGDTIKSGSTSPTMSRRPRVADVRKPSTSSVRSSGRYEDVSRIGKARTQRKVTWSPEVDEEQKNRKHPSARFEDMSEEPTHSKNRGSEEITADVSDVIFDNMTSAEVRNSEAMLSDSEYISRLARGKVSLVKDAEGWCDAYHLNKDDIQEDAMKLLAGDFRNLYEDLSGEDLLEVKKRLAQMHSMTNDDLMNSLR